MENATKLDALIARVEASARACAKWRLDRQNYPKGEASGDLRIGRHEYSDAIDSLHIEDWDNPGKDFDGLVEQRESARDACDAADVSLWDVHVAAWRLAMQGDEDDAS